MGAKFGMEESNFTPISAACRPCGAKKTSTWPLTEPGTVDAFCAMLAVTRHSQ